MKATLFVVFLAFACALAQDIESLVVDDFTVGADSQQVIITLGDDLEPGEQSVSDSTSLTVPGCSNLVGCSRDMIVEVTSGFQSRSFTSNIFGVDGNTGEWSVSSPKTSASSYTLQYDGADESPELDISGLGGIDLTDNGLTFEFRFSIILDLTSTFTITVYSPNGGSCERSLVVPGTVTGYDYEDTLFDFEFDSFSGNCDFANVGAIEVFLPSTDALDAIVRRISTIGSAPPSPTPTSSPLPTASNTPTRPPTASNTPAPSASTTPIPPAFTWYTFDDDDNGRSSCEEERPRESYHFNDNNIIYYYFTGSSNSGSSSPASALAVGLTFMVTVALALF